MFRTCSRRPRDLRRLIEAFQFHPLLILVISPSLAAIGFHQASVILVTPKTSAKRDSLASTVAVLCRVGIPGFVSELNENVDWSLVSPHVDVVDLYLEHSVVEGSRSLVELDGRLVEVFTLSIDRETPEGSLTLETAPTTSAATTLAMTWLTRLCDSILFDELDIRLDATMATSALILLIGGEEMLWTDSSGTGESTMFDDLQSGSRGKSRDELRSFDEDGIPRAGGPWSLWSSSPQIFSGDLSCSGSVPGARFAEMRPWGPEARVVLGAGQNGDPELDSDEIDIWAGNSLRPFPFFLEDVLASAVRRVHLVPSSTASQ